MFGLFGHRSIDPAIVTAVSVIAFVTVALIYALMLFAYPLYLFSIKRAGDGIKTVIFNAVFLLVLFSISVACIYLFSDRITLTSLDRQLNSVMYMPKDELIQRSEDARVKAENARLEYENHPVEKTMPAEVINIAPENRIYPYTININTGEKTPIEP